MNLFDLSAKITLDTSEYEQGISNAGTKMSGLATLLRGGVVTGAKVAGGAILGVGAATGALAGLLVKGASSTAQYGDGIDKMSQKLGISAEAYQEWSAILQHSGTSMESMSATFKTLSNAAQDASTDQQAAFAKLGLSMDDVASMSTEDLFASVISGLQNMESGTERTALATDLLGRGAMEMGALLNTSAEDTEAMRQRVHDLGGVLSDDAVKSSAQFQDNLQDLKTAFSGVKNSITTEMLPGLNLAMDGFTMLVSGEDGAQEAISKGLSDLVGNISDAIPQIATMGGAIINGLIDAIDENLPSLIDSGVNILIQIINGIVEHLPQIASAAAQVLRSFANAIVKNAPRLFSAAKTAIRNILTDVFGVDEGTADAFIGTIQTVFDTVGDIIDSIKEAIGTITEPLGRVSIDWESVWNGMSEIISTVGGFISEAIGLVGEAIGGIVDWLVSLGEEAQTEGTIMNDIWTGIQDLFTAVWDAIGAIIDQGIEQFQSVMDTFSWLRTQMETDGTAINTVWENIQLGISTFIDIITGVINVFTALLTGDFSGAWDAIQTTIDSVVSNISDAVSNTFGYIADTLSNIGTNIKNDITNKWETIKSNVSSKVDTIKSNISSKWDSIKSNLQSKMDTIKSNMSSKWDSIKTNVSSKVDSIKSKISTGFESAKTTVTNKFNAIKDAITNKLTAAKTSVQNLIDQIKAKFNFTWSLPHLKMPHPYIRGSFSLNPPSVPTFGISWYKKAMDNAYLLDGATIFGASGGNLLGGGEAGREMIVGENKLRDIMGAGALERAVQDATTQILNYLREIVSNQDQVLVLDSGVLVGATAARMNAELGRIQLRGRVR